MCRAVCTIMKILEWMSNNFLKLNAETTEILIFGFRAQLPKFSITHVQILELTSSFIQAH